MSVYLIRTLVSSCTGYYRLRIVKLPRKIKRVSTRDDLVGTRTMTNLGLVHTSATLTRLIARKVCVLSIEHFSIVHGDAPVSEVNPLLEFSDARFGLKSSRTWERRDLFRTTSLGLDSRHKYIAEPVIMSAPTLTHCPRSTYHHSISGSTIWFCFDQKNLT